MPGRRTRFELGMSKWVARTGASLVALAILGASCDNSNPNPDQRLGQDEPTPATLPTSIRAVVFASQCPLPTDCDSKYIDTASAQVAVLKPDVVIATEFFWKKDNYLNFAQKVGLRYYTRGPGGQDGVTGGVVLLSRFPFSATSTDVFREALLPDSLVKKGTVFGKVRLGKNARGEVIELQLIGTHFQAKTSGDWIKTHTSQIAQQSDFVKNAIDRGVLTLYGGDINLTQDVPTWLCSDDDCRAGVLSNWKKVSDDVLAPYRFISASQVCSESSKIEDCLAEALSEKAGQENDVIKLFVSNTSALDSKGVSLVPRKIESVSTISDHRTWAATLEVKTR